MMLFLIRIKKKKNSCVLEYFLSFFFFFFETVYLQSFLKKGARISGGISGTRYVCLFQEVFNCKMELVQQKVRKA